jgi:hypothetical protein
MELIKNKKLANGIMLDFSDDSKNITGDRCLVRLRCVISFPLLPWMEEKIEQSGQAREYIQSKMNDGLQHDLTWERNFVDEKEKDDCLEALISRANGISDYFTNDEFMTRLFEKRIAALREEYTCRNERDDHDRMRLIDPGQDEDEPADFSACFSDTTTTVCE